MGNCYSCRGKLGFGPKIYRMADKQKKEFCLKCAILWDEKQKQTTLKLICEKSAPVPYFTVPNVTTADPIQKDYLFVGHLAFMDKGICFVKLSEYKKDAPTSPFGFATISWLWGGALDQALANRTPEHKANIQAAHKQAEQTKPENFEDFLRKGLSFLYFPRQTLILVTYDRKKGLLVKTNCSPSETYFALPPEAYGQIKPFIAKYFGFAQTA